MEKLKNLVSWAQDQLDKETTIYIFKEGTHDLTFDLDFKPRESSGPDGHTYFSFRAWRTDRPDVMYWVRQKAGTAVFREMVELLADGKDRIIFTAVRSDAQDGRVALSCAAFDAFSG